MGDNKADDKKVVKKHAIRSGWIRIPLKVLMWILVFMLVLPVLVYLPPVQDLAVKIAVNVVRSGTGMTVGVGKAAPEVSARRLAARCICPYGKGRYHGPCRRALADVKLLPFSGLTSTSTVCCSVRGLLRNGFGGLVDACRHPCRKACLKSTTGVRSVLLRTR